MSEENQTVNQEQKAEIEEIFESQENGQPIADIVEPVNQQDISNQNRDDENLMNGRIGRWTEQEKKKYLQLQKIMPRQWKRMAQFITDRTPEQIRSHGQKVEKKRLNEEQRVNPCLILENLANNQDKFRPVTRSRHKKTSHTRKLMQMEEEEYGQSSHSSKKSSEIHRQRQQFNQREGQIQPVIKFNDRLPENSFLRQFISYTKAQFGIRRPIFPLFPTNNEAIDRQKLKKKYMRK